MRRLCICPVFNSWMWSHYSHINIVFCSLPVPADQCNSHQQLPSDWCIYKSFDPLCRLWIPCQRMVCVLLTCSKGELQPTSKLWTPRGEKLRKGKKQGGWEMTPWQGVKKYPLTNGETRKKRKVIAGNQYVVIRSVNSNANISARCHGSAHVSRNRGEK